MPRERRGRGSHGRAHVVLLGEDHEADGRGAIIRMRHAESQKSLDVRLAADRKHVRDGQRQRRLAKGRGAVLLYDGGLVLAIRVVDVVIAITDRSLETIAVDLHARHRVGAVHFHHFMSEGSDGRALAVGDDGGLPFQNLLELVFCGRRLYTISRGPALLVRLRRFFLLC